MMTTAPPQVMTQVYIAAFLVNLIHSVFLTRFVFILNRRIKQKKSCNRRAGPVPSAARVTIVFPDSFSHSFEELVQNPLFDIFVVLITE